MIIYEDGHGIWTCTGDGPGGRIQGFGSTKQDAIDHFEALSRRSDLGVQSRGYRIKAYQSRSKTQQRRQRRKTAQKKRYELQSLFLIPAQSNPHSVQVTSATA